MQSVGLSQDTRFRRVQPVVATAVEQRGVRTALTVTAWVMVTALAAQAAFYLPGNPVPLTLQTAAVLACGMCCTPRVAMMSMLTYLACGLAGLPVFAGFASGPGVALAASFGYLLSFVLAAPLMSVVVRDRVSGRVRGVGEVFLWAMVMHAFVLACGAAWMRATLGLTIEAAIVLGVVPFAVGSVVKSVIVSALPVR